MTSLVGRRQASQMDGSSVTTATHTSSSSYTRGPGSVSSTTSYSDRSGSYSYSYSNTKTASATATTTSTDATAAGGPMKPRTSVVAGKRLPLTPQGQQQLPPRPPLPAAQRPLAAQRPGSSSGSYSYSYDYSHSHSGGSGDDSSEGSYDYSYSDEEATDTHTISSITKSFTSSSEGHAVAPRKQAPVSVDSHSYSGSPSSYSGSYGYSYSTVTGDDTAGTTGSYDSYSSYTRSSGSYSYSHNTGSATGTTESISSGHKGGTASMSVRTKRPAVQSSGSYSYSHSASSKDATTPAAHRYDSAASSGSDIGSDMSLTHSAQDSGRSVASSSPPSPRQKDGANLPPLHQGSSITTSSIIRPSRTLSESVPSSVTRSSSTPSMKPPPPREVLVLMTNAEESPVIAELPRVCLVPRGAGDVLSRLLERISCVQAEVLRREAEESAMAVMNKEKEEEKKKKKKKKEEKETKNGKSGSDDANKVPGPPEVPAGHFVRRSLKFALRAVGVCDAAERSAALNALFASNTPISRDAAYSFLDIRSHHCLVQRVAARFHAHDRFGSGEVPLPVALDLLSRCGIARVSAAGAALSIVSAAARPMLRVASHAEKNSPTGSAAIAELQPTPRASRSAEIIDETVDVCRAGQAGVDVYWSEHNGDVFVGPRLVVRGVRSRADGRALTAQLAAMVFVCRAVDACAVRDATRSAVQYGPLLAALLDNGNLNGNINGNINGNGNGSVSGARSLLVENAIAAVLDPMRAAVALEEKVMRAAGAADSLFAAHPSRPIAADWAQPNNPNNSNNPNNPSEPHEPNAAEVCCAVSIVKLRVAVAAPAGARCYCLVSAQRATCAEWMAPVEIPSRCVRPSRRGGFTWEFDSDAASRVLFAGARGDTLYVEACCEAPGCGAVCAGHATVAAAALRSGSLPLADGSLVESGDPKALEDFTEPNGLNGPNGTKGPKALEAPKGLWCMPWRGRCAQRKPLGAAALEIKVSKVRPRDLPPRAELPLRLLALHRHVPLVALIRDAVAHSAVPGAHSAAQAVRQQHAQACLAVAASTTLMDAVLVLWDRTVRGKLGPKPKEPAQKRAAVVALATKIAAAHNCVAHADSRAIADLVTGTARIPAMVDTQAPMKPIEI